jgi:hypothetical protein
MTGGSHTDLVELLAGHGIGCIYEVAEREFARG